MLGVLIGPLTQAQIFLQRLRRPLAVVVIALQKELNLADKLPALEALIRHLVSDQVVNGSRQLVLCRLGKSGLLIVQGVGKTDPQHRGDTVGVGGVRGQGNRYVPLLKDEGQNVIRQRGIQPHTRLNVGKGLAVATEYHRLQYIAQITVAKIAKQILLGRLAEGVHQQLIEDRDDKPPEIPRLVLP